VIAIPTKAYPLSWPIGVPRTQFRADAPFGARMRKPGQPQRNLRTEVGSASEELYRELRLIRGSSRHVISSNLPARPDGLPYADGSVGGGDPGVVAYWIIRAQRGGKSVDVPYCMPCDKWKRVADNLHALALSIEAMRGMERWGAVKTEQAFAGFASLPPGDGSADSATVTIRRPWREVLGMPVFEENDPEIQLAVAKTLHRKLAAKFHPDRGGDHAAAAEINAAMDEAEKELGRTVAS
jgi:hypothetical protein